ncbi:MAG: hypothetical protein NTY77_09600 [Elusimicrobia bacterium]|nr:hypothetical protein [Elusimicrobiota bacterium]
MLAPIRREPDAGSVRRWLGPAIIVVAGALALAVAFRIGPGRPPTPPVPVARPAAAARPSAPEPSAPAPSAQAATEVPLAPAPSREVPAVEFNDVPRDALALVMAPGGCQVCGDRTDWGRRLGGGARMGSLPAGLAKDFGTGGKRTWTAHQAVLVSVQGPDDMGNAPASWSCCSSR